MTFNKIVLWVIENWRNIITISGTVFGLMGVILFFRERKSKKPRYTMVNNNIIQNFTSKLEGLEINYKGNNISNLNITKIAFWNHGKLTINNNDIAKAKPIKIFMKANGRILDAELLKVINPANMIQIYLQENRKELVLNFDYLDKNDGCVIQIIHDGDFLENVRMTGIIKGFGEPELVLSPILTTARSSSFRSLSSSINISVLKLQIPFGIIMIISFIILIFIEESSSLGLIGLIFSTLFTIGMFSLIKKIPKELDLLNNNFVSKVDINK